MSTKKKLKKEANRQEGETRVDRKNAAMLWSYLGVCLVLLAGIILAGTQAWFLAQHLRPSKDIRAGLASYTPWPEEARVPFQRFLLQNEGRVKPFNTYARYTLMQINNSGRVAFETKDGIKHSLKPDEWLLDTLFRVELARELPIFNVDDTAAIEAIGIEPKEGRKIHSKRDRYSYNHLITQRARLAEEGARISQKQQEYEKSGKDPNLQPNREELLLLRLSRNVSLFEYLLGQFSAIRGAEQPVNDEYMPEPMKQLASKIDMREFLNIMPEMGMNDLFSFLRQQPTTEQDRLLQGPFMLFFRYATSAQHFNAFPSEDQLNEEWVALGDAMVGAMADKALRPWVIDRLTAVKDLYEGQKTMFAGLEAELKKTEKKKPSYKDLPKETRLGWIQPFADQCNAFLQRQLDETQARFVAHVSDIDRQIAAANEPLEKERLHDKKAKLIPEGKTAALEVKLYNSGYFNSAVAWYVFGFLAAALSWFSPGSKFSSIMRWGALAFILLGVYYNIAGIVMRCVVQGRPPITNLYDTVIFITASVVLLALFLEFLNRLGVGFLLASVAGAAGMFLSFRYEAKEATDTMGPLQAVLDTNFWLATHVTTINIGYAAGLLAMLLGMYYLIYRFLRPLPRVTSAIVNKKPLPNHLIFQEDKKERDYLRAISGMTYGIVCFCLLFSIIGTILGGVWANYSWGRFWGWDPKENGALMICLWSLVILHAKMGGYIRNIGIAVNAIFLGMIVGFSWWGVNNLGIGLHSYGFTEGVWNALFLSWAVSVAVMACGFPLWLHERNARTKPSQPHPLSTQKAKNEGGEGDLKEKALA